MPTQIIHPQLGKGVIEKKRYAGFQIFIRFQSGYSRWFSSFEVRLWMVDGIEATSPASTDVSPSEIDTIKNVADLAQGIEDELQREPAPLATTVSYPQPIGSETYSPVSTDVSPFEIESTKIVADLTQETEEKQHKEPAPLADRIPSPSLAETVIYLPAITPQPSEPEIKREFITWVPESKVSTAPTPDLLNESMPSEEKVQAEKHVHPGKKFNLWEYCQEIEHAQKQPIPQSVTTPDSAISLEEQKKYRRILESLRLGGVPQDLVTSFTCGREEEVENILSWLSGDDGALLLLGDYGSGKSHLLDLIKAIAQYNGWVVAQTEIDPQEVAFNKPKRVYQALINSLEYRRADGDIGGFQEFVEDLMSCEEEALQQLEEHPILKILFYGWNQDDDNDGLFDSLRGEGESGTYLLPDFQTGANIYCNLISEIGWTSRNLLGLKGLLILFDEAEAIDVGWYSSYAYQKAMNMFHGLLLMAKSDPRLRTEYNDRLDYQGSCKVGGLTGLIYGGRRTSRNKVPIPYLAEDESCTKMVFSFVPDMVESINVLSPLHDTVQSLPRCLIEPLGDEDYDKLYERLRELYQSAYGFTPHQDVLPYLPRDKTRLFVKGVIESMDLERHNPAISADELFLTMDDLKYG